MAKPIFTEEEKRKSRKEVIEMSKEQSKDDMDSLIAANNHKDKIEHYAKTYPKEAKKDLESASKDVTDAEERLRSDINSTRILHDYDRGYKEHR